MIDLIHLYITLFLLVNYKCLKKNQNCLVRVCGRRDQQVLFVSLEPLESPSDRHSCASYASASFHSKAVESLAGGGGSEAQRVKEDAQRKVRQVEDVLTRRIHLLEEVSLQALRRLSSQWVHNRGGRTLLLFPVICQGVNRTKSPLTEYPLGSSPALGTEHTESTPVYPARCPLLSASSR